MHTCKEGPRWQTTSELDDQGMRMMALFEFEINILQGLIHIDIDSPIYIAGHNGMVGSAICRVLEQRGHTNLIKASSSELDLRRQKDVEDFFAERKPEYVFVAAARVGGILDNMTRKAQFLYDNLMIESNIIHSAYQSKVKKLLFLGSSCIYPAHFTRPIREDDLLTGTLEPTNEGYAIAKIAGIKLCQYYFQQFNVPFISIMPTNLYGSRDNFSDDRSHVVPALIRRIHEAKINASPAVTIWGSGTPLREFLYVDDLAEAALFVMQAYNDLQFLNVGCGTDVSIKELAETIKAVVEYEGELIFDTSKPDGMARKLLDVSKINALGWKSKTSLTDGLKMTYEWYKHHIAAPH